MRGRTNLHDGISLNANTAEYTVLGDDIIGGDFVEMSSKLIGALGLDEYYGAYRFIDELSDGNYFCVYDTKLSILSRDSNGQYSVVVSEFALDTTYASNYWIKIATDTYTRIALNTTSLRFYTVYYDSTSKEISAKSTYLAVDSSKTASDNFVSWIKKDDTTLFGFYISYNSSNAKYLEAFDLTYADSSYTSPNFAIANLTTTSLNITDSYYYYPEDIIKIADTEQYVLIYHSQNTKGSAGIVQKRYWGRYGTGTTKSYTLLRQERNNLGIPVSQFNPDGYITFVNYATDGCYQTNVWFDATDLTSVTTVIGDTSKITDVVIANYGFKSNIRNFQTFLLSTEDNIEQYLISYDTGISIFKLAVLEYDRSVHQVTVYNPSTLTYTHSSLSWTPPTMGLYKRGDNQFIVLCPLEIDGEVKFTAIGDMKIEFNLPHTGADTKLLVQKITSANYISGVAKTSGSDGDTIVCYVPIVD